MEKEFRGFVVSIVLVTLIGCILLFAGCAKEEPEEYKIGSMLPLTGDAAQWGAEPQKAIQMAVEEINSAGGINGKKLKVIFEDTQATPKLGTSALNKLITLDKVQVVVGPVASSVMLAIAPIANSNQVVLISPSATSNVLTDAGDYIFRVINSDVIEGSAMATVIAKEFNHKKGAILATNSVGAVGVGKIFEKTFTDLGNQILAYEEADEGSIDFKSILVKIKSANPEFIYVIAYPKETGIMIKQIREAEIAVPIFSAQPAEDPQVVGIAGDAIDGVIYSTTTLPSEVLGTAYDTFLERFKEKYSEAPGSFASEAYDALYLVVKALSGGAESGEQIKNYLYSVKGYKGVSGEMSFDRNGDVDKPIVIKKYSGRDSHPMLLFVGGNIRELGK